MTMEATEKKPTARKGVQKWYVNINEGYGVKVDAANVEGAIMAAFAKYWADNHSPDTMGYDIHVTNLTIAEAIGLAGDGTP